MPAPPRSFLTVTDTPIRWQVPALPIAGWAIDSADVVALFRRDCASGKPALVRRFRRSKKTEWEWITRPTDGVAVTAADVIILRKEFERCERAWGLFDTSGAEDGTKSTNPAKRQAGPGAPPKHD